MLHRRVVAIHQPNFFPWLGYFDKIIKADVFILMDNVQLQKTGGTWTNRVKLLVNGKPSWITVPIVRSFSGHKNILDIQINHMSDWRVKFKKTIQINYTNAPYFKSLQKFVESIICFDTHLLSDFNINAISKICDLLDIDSKKIVRGSSLGVSGNATGLLVAMTSAVNGTTYLCGGGAGGYQEDEKFAANGLDLVYQNFAHPVYYQQQIQEFIPGLSILDVLMNCGIDGTKQLLRLK